MQETPGALSPNKCLLDFLDSLSYAQVEQCLSVPPRAECHFLDGLDQCRGQKDCPFQGLQSTITLLILGLYGFHRDWKCFIRDVLLWNCRHKTISLSKENDLGRKAPCQEFYNFSIAVLAWVEEAQEQGEEAKVRPNPTVFQSD